MLSGREASGITRRRGPRGCFAAAPHDTSGDVWNGTLFHFSAANPLPHYDCQQLLLVITSAHAARAAHKRCKEFVNAVPGLKSQFCQSLDSQTTCDTGFQYTLKCFGEQHGIINVSASPGACALYFEERLD